MFMPGTASDKRRTPSPSADMAHPPRRLSPPASRSYSPATAARRKNLPAPTPTSHGISGQYLKLEHGDGGVSGALLPPPPITGNSFSRSSSADRGSRPGTPSSMSYSRPSTPSLAVPGSRPMTPKSPATEEKQKLKKGNAWFGSKKKEKDHTKGPVAWIAGHPQKLPYEVDGLLSARPELELCDHTGGNCFVYLWPKSSGKGASFKVSTAIFAASPVLTGLASGDISSHSGDIAGEDRLQIPLDARAQTLSLQDLSTPPVTPERNWNHTSSTSAGGPKSTNLYLPDKLSSNSSSTSANNNMDDLQKLIDVRNFFAFLCGQSLIATEQKHSFFDIFMTIGDLLKICEFSNLDGSTFGEVASNSFDNYVEELELADVRQSREKTIEGIVLGERMKSVLLYNEAFTHGVGRYDDLIAMKAPKFELISHITQNRLVTAARDLSKRTAAIREILTEFNFPSLFAGIMSSKVSEERKEGVRFDAWKESFLGTRRFIAGLLQHRYGHWPPKARSKKNDLETSGLNRLVLVELYRDMTSLYDLLVDRKSLTTRTVDGIDLAGAREEPVIRAVRTILSEYDRSSPPVKPPIPFDIPQLPTLKTTRPDFGRGDKKQDTKAASKKLKDDEIVKILRASWNPDAVLTPFVDAFRDMEKRAAHSCSLAELQELRVGQWIFMYAVLQALPMLAVDAPGIKHTQGVEYFLCSPPRSGVPWINSTAAGGRTWFSIGDGGGVVSLPSDLIEHGVEGIYRRSHCWQMAGQWAAANPILAEAMKEQDRTNSSAPPVQQDELLPSFAPGANPAASLLRPASAASNYNTNSRRTSFMSLGLEALPLPSGVAPDGSVPAAGGSRPASPGLRPRTPAHNVDASRTFDAILADVGDGKGKSKKKEKK